MSITGLSEALSDFNEAVDAYLRPTVFLRKSNLDDAEGHVTSETVRSIALTNILLRMDYAGSTASTKTQGPKKRFRQLFDQIREDLVCEEAPVRKEGLVLLGKVLTRCPDLKVPEATVEALVTLCMSRLFDWHSIEGAMLIFLGLLEHHADRVRWVTVLMEVEEEEENSKAQHGGGADNAVSSAASLSGDELLDSSTSATPTGKSDDGGGGSSIPNTAKKLERVPCVRAILDSIVRRVHGPAFAQPVRQSIYRILSICLSNFAHDVFSIGPRAIVGVCCQIENEKDPRNLLVTFPLMATLLSRFSDLIREDQQHIELISDVLFVYFPIRFRPPTNDPYNVTEDQLKEALTQCLFASRRLQPAVLEMLLDVLNDAVMSAKDSDVDEAIGALRKAATQFDPPVISDHCTLFLEIIKLAAWQTPCRYLPAMAATLGLFLPSASPAVAEKIAKDCVDHLVKPELVGESPGLLAARVVLQEAATRAAACNAALGAALHAAVVRRYYDEVVKGMMMSLCESCTADGQQPVVSTDGPVASWNRVAADLTLIANIVQIVDETGHLHVAAITALTQYSGTLAHQPPAAAALLRLYISSCHSTDQWKSGLGLLIDILGFPLPPEMSIGTASFGTWVSPLKRLAEQDLRLHATIERSSSMPSDQNFASAVYDNLRIVTEVNTEAQDIVMSVAAEALSRLSVAASSSSDGTLIMTALEAAKRNRLGIVLGLLVPSPRTNDEATCEQGKDEDGSPLPPTQHPREHARRLVGVLFDTLVVMSHALEQEWDTRDCVGWVIERIVNALLALARDTRSADPSLFQSGIRRVVKATVADSGSPASIDVPVSADTHTSAMASLVQSLGHSSGSSSPTASLRAIGELIAAVAPCRDDLPFLTEMLTVVVGLLRDSNHKAAPAILILARPLETLLSLSQNSTEDASFQELLESVEAVCQDYACGPCHGDLSRNQKEEVTTAARVCLSTMILHGTDQLANRLLLGLRDCWNRVYEEGTGAVIDTALTRGFALRGRVLRLLKTEPVDSVVAELVSQLDIVTSVGTDGDAAIGTSSPARAAFAPFTLRCVLRSNMHPPGSDGDRPKSATANNGLPSLEIPDAFVVRLCQVWLPTLIAKLNNPSLPDDAIPMSPHRIEILALIGAIVADLRVESLDTALPTGFGETMFVALSSSPWLSAAAAAPSSIEIRILLDDLNGCLIAFFLKILLHERRRPAAGRDVADRLSHSLLTACLSQERIADIVNACLRQARCNTIPLIRQHALRCLFTLGQMVRQYPALESCVSTVVDGVRPVLDDRHQEVRRAAAVCANIWSCLLVG